MQDYDFREVCTNSVLRKQHFDFRLSITSEDKEEAIKNIDLFLNEKPSVNVKYHKYTKQVKELVFVFTGQGSQFAGMGKKFYDNFPVFREVLDRLDKLFIEKRGESLLHLMFNAPEEDLTLTENAQPAIFAFEYGLYKLWLTFGVKVKTLLGHSVGEYTAAAAAGVFSVEEGFNLLIERGKVMGSLDKIGAMATVFLPLEILSEILKKLNVDINIAAENTKNSVVVSGHKKDILSLEKWCKEHGVSIKKLKVSNAFHSYLMQPAMEELRVKWKNKQFKKPKLKLISNQTGLPASDSISTLDYWLDHLMNNVKFHQSIKYLVDKKNEVFFEIGPKPVLSNFINTSFEEVQTIFCSEKNNCLQDISNAIGQFISLGVNLNLNNIYDSEDCDRVLLPNYPFEKKSFWLPSKNSQNQSDIFKINWKTGFPTIESTENRCNENLWVLFGDYKSQISKTINESLNGQKTFFYNTDEWECEENIVTAIRELKNNLQAQGVKIIFMPSETLPLTGQIFFLTTLLKQLNAELERDNSVDLHYLFRKNHPEKIAESQKSVDYALTGIIKSAQYEIENINCYITEISGTHGDEEVSCFLYRISNSNNRAFYERITKKEVSVPQLESITLNKHSFSLPKDVKKVFDFRRIRRNRFVPLRKAFKRKYC
nr:acyltransferase domain-containing protein [Aquimarina agarivorans]